jgi:hypothetical protein
MPLVVMPLVPLMVLAVSHHLLVCTASASAINIYCLLHLHLPI